MYIRTHTHTYEREEVDASICLVLISVKSCTWNFFPAREQIQKYWVTREKRPWSFRKISPVIFFFSPWTFLKKPPVKQNLARDHFQNRNDHGCLFVSRGEKKHCTRFTTSNVIVMLRLSLMVGMGWGVSLLKFSLWGLFSRRFYVSCPPFESALAFTHLFACFL